jgi:hypothetical protein
VHIWLVTFVDYDLGYFDDETFRLEPIDNPFDSKLSPMSPEWTPKESSTATESQRRYEIVSGPQADRPKGPTANPSGRTSATCS